MRDAPCKSNYRDDACGITFEVCDKLVGRAQEVVYYHFVLVVLEVLVRQDLKCISVDPILTPYVHILLFGCQRRDA